MLFAVSVGEFSLLQLLLFLLPVIFLSWCYLGKCHCTCRLQQLSYCNTCSLSVYISQVISQLTCSSSPGLYWFAAHIVDTGVKESTPFINCYMFTCYSVVGTIMHCTYYTWKCQSLINDRFADLKRNMHTQLFEGTSTVGL